MRDGAGPHGHGELAIPRYSLLLTMISSGVPSRKWIGGLVLGAITAVRCGSAAATQPAAPPKSTFGKNLSLAVSFGSALAQGDKSVTAQFALTNNGAAAFDGCFGPAWGVSVIVGGHDAGHYVRAEHPSCDERFKLLPRQTIVWPKTVPLSNLRSGPAKVTGWVRIVDPAACGKSYGCRDTSVASPMMTMAIGRK